jgi:choline dehydrogenase-like flavoprotein
MLSMANLDADVCIVGSGAGASPIAYELVKAGFRVVVLEKGPWITTEQFNKDEQAVTRKQSLRPSVNDEYHLTVRQNSKGEWVEKSTKEGGTSLWNGNMVGGSSNLMSGFFHRMKPTDFRLKSTYSQLPDANIVDWPISYSELEPYYTKVEEVVGVSGKIIPHKALEPRSTENFPQPALTENHVANLIDEAAQKIGVSTFPVPRAILSQPKNARKSCYYSNYCGSYGCSSDAKGSGRAALLNDIALSDNCTIIPQAKVYYLKTNGQGKIIEAHYYDKQGTEKFITAHLFVVAAQAVETSRLLLMSKNLEFPNGLANNNGQVGKNLLFSAGGVGSCFLNYADFDTETAQKLKQQGVFVNRATQEWYEFTDDRFGNQPVKGGTIDFLWEHSNPVAKATKQKWDGSRFVFGSELKTRIHDYFTKGRKLKFEIFVDWSPNDHCFVTLADNDFDKWGDPVAKVWMGNHPQDVAVGEYLAEKAAKIFEQLGGKDITWSITGAPSTNLMAGGCRFGNDPKSSVLNKDCRAHEVDNLYVTDGSFMPTGGSVTYTWTIYANAFRVAEIIKEHLQSISI